MRREEANYFYVGLFVITMAGLLVVVLFMVTGRALDTESYFTRFRNITGVTLGSPVTFGGYQIGQVNKIVPERSNGETRFRLELKVRAGWEIPVDSVARIMAPGLLAEYQVDILEGESGTLLGPGGMIEARHGGGMFASLETLVAEVKDLSETGIKPLLASLNEQVTSVGSELSMHVPRIAQGIAELVERVNRNMAQLGELLNDDTRGHVASIVSNTDDITKELKSLATAFNDSNRQLNELLRRSNGLVADNAEGIRDAVTDLRRSVAVVSRDIDTIVYNLEASSRNMNEFTRQLRDNPAILLNSRPPEDRGGERP